MFRRMTSVRSKLIARRVALVVAPLAVVGATLSTASAADRDGPWWRRHREPRVGVVIHADIPPQRVVIGRPVDVCDEVPAGLQMTAYQSKDRVIVIINGTNRAAGFRTALTAEGSA